MIPQRLTALFISNEERWYYDLLLCLLSCFLVISMWQFIILRHFNILLNWIQNKVASFAWNFFIIDFRICIWFVLCLRNCLIVIWNYSFECLILKYFNSCCVEIKIFNLKGLIEKYLFSSFLIVKCSIRSFKISQIYSLVTTVLLKR